MIWKAIIPLKQACDRKSRLAEVYTLAQRIRLSDDMARHVFAMASAASLNPSILSPAPFSSMPWERDHGQGLNLELDRLLCRHGSGPLLVVHADLPLLSHTDLLEMISAAEHCGAAIAPDHLGVGTNAIALRDPAHFTFAFGPGSLSAHMTARPLAGIVRTSGLAFDIDRPADLSRLAVHMRA